MPGVKECTGQTKAHLYFEMCLNFPSMDTQSGKRSGGSRLATAPRVCRRCSMSPLGLEDALTLLREEQAQLSTPSELDGTAQSHCSELAPRERVVSGSLSRRFHHSA